MKRHFIFTSGRSGSNYLSNTLNLCPGCVNYGEVLGEWTLPYKFMGKFLCDDSGSDRYLNYIYSSRLFFRVAQIYSAYVHLKSGRRLNYKAIENVTSIGVKDFLVTLERCHGLEFLQKNRDIKIIYLYRSNLLKRHVSGVFMKENKVHTAYQKQDIDSVILNVDRMLNSLDIMSKESAREKEFISKLQTHEVFILEYESYFESSDSITYWNNRIFDFLEITPVRSTSSQKKILPDSLEETVSNFEEVVASLNGTPYERYIY